MRTASGKRTLAHGPTGKARSTARSVLCPPSPWRATPTARRTPDASAYAGKFSGKYARLVIEGCGGHNLPQEAPQAFAQAVIDVDGYSPVKITGEAATPPHP